MTVLKFERPKLHLLVWAIFICYERVVGFSVYGRFANFWNYIAAYLIDITFFYINAHLVFPNAYKKNKFVYHRLFLMIVAEITIYISCKYFFLFLFGLLNVPAAPRFTTHGFFISYYLIRFTFLLGLSTGYWFASTTLLNQKKIEELERSQLQNQLEHQELEKTL